MKILLAAMGYEYLRVGVARSFEYYTFYDALQRLGHDVTFFEYDTLAAKHGRTVMNELLVAAVRRDQPQLLFTVLHTDELDPEVVQWVSQETATTTLNWFCDDHWRFEDFSRVWAPRFNWVATTSRKALQSYAAAGIGNAILTQWGCNQQDRKSVV